MNTEKLQQLISEIRGKKCFRAWDGAPPAIFFEVGEPINVEERQGEFSLCVMGAFWKIEKAGIVLADPSFEKSKIIAALKFFEGEVVKNILIGENTQDKIIFSNDLWITIDRSGNKEWSIVAPVQEVTFTASGHEFVK